MLDGRSPAYIQFDLPTETRRPSNYRDFKKTLTNLILPEKPSPYLSFGSKAGNVLHTKLRLSASQLNAHRFTIGKTTSPACMCGHGSEDSPHFLFSCPLHAVARNNLFQTLTLVLNLNFSQLPRANQVDILLNGPQKDENISRNVALSLQNFLFKTQRFTK